MLSMEEDKKSFKFAGKEGSLNLKKKEKLGRNWRRVGGLKQACCHSIIDRHTSKKLVSLVPRNRR